MGARWLVLLSLLVGWSCGEVLDEPVGGHRSTSLPARAAELFAPDGPGPYTVGTARFTAAMTGGRLTTVQVFYPTTEEPDCATTYTVTPAGGSSFDVTTLLCAASDAAAAPGPFPLIVQAHGGGAPGESHQLLSQLPMHETLATHGFIVALALHSGNARDRVLDLGVLTDRMLARNADPEDSLHGRIDPSRIGTGGLSAGGTSTFNFAAGHTGFGIAPDRRLRAAVFYEPGQAGISFADAATLDIPYLIMGGDQFSSGLLVPELFETTTEAAPRIHVHTPGSLHISYATGHCHVNEAAREAALLADPEIPEPLTTLLDGDRVAAQAYDLWNLGDRLFASLGAGFGGGRHFCNRLGVQSVRSLDTSPADGFTDEPPFRTVDPPYVLAPGVPSETMVPLVTLYTVAFFKVHLAGDHRYVRYLAPGYAARNDLPVTVQIAP
jgi:dienelactone hydrolase